MQDFKQGDIVRYVVDPEWPEYATPGSVLEIREYIGKNAKDVDSYRCKLIFGEWTEEGYTHTYDGDSATFLLTELEAVDETIPEA
jgi:hypothetical protein